jgi:hypothetical protein
MEGPMSAFLLHFSRKTWWILALVAGLALGLAVALIFHPDGKIAGISSTSGDRVTPADMRREVDAACMAFGVGKEDIRVRQERDSAGEHRIAVDDQFRPLEFHYALSRRVAKYGVHIVGEERPREKKVALRLLQEDKQIWNVILSIQKTARKEDRHRP